MFRVGRIPYLNCEPYFAHLTGFPTLDLPPRQLGEALARGEADAAALSLADFLRLEPSLEGLPFGIATDGPARSVILFSDRDPAERHGQAPSPISKLGADAIAWRNVRRASALRSYPGCRANRRILSTVDAFTGSVSVSGFETK